MLKNKIKKLKIVKCIPIFFGMVQFLTTLTKI